MIEFFLMTIGIFLILAVVGAKLNCRVSRRQIKDIERCIIEDCAHQCGVSVEEFQRMLKDECQNGRYERKRPNLRVVK